MDGVAYVGFFPSNEHINRDCERNSIRFKLFWMMFNSAYMSKSYPIHNSQITNYSVRSVTTCNSTEWIKWLMWWWWSFSGTILLKVHINLVVWIIIYAQWKVLMWWQHYYAFIYLKNVYFCINFPEIHLLLVHKYITLFEIYSDNDLFYCCWALFIIRTI